MFEALRRRADDARQDCFVASGETGQAQPGCTNVWHLKAAYDRSQELGLLEPDEPHPYPHAVYQQALRADFTEAERVRIRVQLGLVDNDSYTESGDDSV